MGRQSESGHGPDFAPSQPGLRRRSVLAQVGGGANFRVLGEEGKLNPIWPTSIVFQLIAEKKLFSESFRRQRMESGGGCLVLS